MRADGTTADEPTHLIYGQRALAAGTFLRDQEALNSKMPVSVLNAIPLALAGRGHAPAWGEQLFAARLPTVLLALLLGCLVWRWAHALFGPLSGALALLAYTFCPNVLAHGHLVTTDVATALGMFAAAYLLWRHLAAPSPGRLIAAAAAFGLAQLTKATALFLVPSFALILLIRLVRTIRAGRELRRHGPLADLARRNAGLPLATRAARSACALLLFCGVAILVLNLGFLCEGTLTPLNRYEFVSPELRSLARIPVLGALPLPLPYAYVQGLDMVARDAEARGWSYLRGAYSETGFRSYFLWGFLVKVPLATQALLVWALWLWGSRRARAPGAEEYLAVPPLLLLLYLSFWFRLDIGLRYLLPAMPFLFVFLSRVAAPPRVPAGTGDGGRWPARAQAALLAGLAVWLGVSSFGIHPHYLAYFNELAGGPANGGRWLIDSNLDWGQDSEYVRRVVAANSPVPVLLDPSGPVAGRVAVGVTSLVGRDPAGARRHAWLRDHFTPVATIGHSWMIFDVSEADVAHCCAGLVRARVVDRPAADLALAGEPIAGGDGVSVRFQEKLNDGMIGAGEPVDAARTVPARLTPVRAWFGVSWPSPRTIGRVAAFPGFDSRGPLARRFLALDYTFQSWDGSSWHDIPGAHATGNQALRVEHRFAPIASRGIRIVVERERNDQGLAAGTGVFRAACLEIAAYRE